MRLNCLLLCFDLVTTAAIYQQHKTSQSFTVFFQCGESDMIFFINVKFVNLDM